ncbi:MAG: TonB-dependent receptor, partial [Alphaproteobacteria bacterium]
QTDLADWGMEGMGGLAISFIGTLLDSFTGGGGECAGTYGCPAVLNPAPEWRHKLRVTWTTPWDTDLSVQWRHFGEVCHFDPDLAHCDKFLPFGDEDYIDLAAVWHVWENVELRGGVNNVFDNRPPLTGFAGTAPGNGNTFPGVYDALGRFIFVGGTVKM